MFFYLSDLHVRMHIRKMEVNMGMNPKKICELTGLQYDRAARTFWGTMQGGYPVFLTEVPRRDTLIFRLIAKAPDTQPEEQIRHALEQWRMAHAGTGVLEHKNRALTAVLSAAKKDTEEAAASAVASLTALAADLGLRPCCMSCGAEYGFSPYLLDGGGIAVCDGCKSHLESNMAADAEKHAAEKPNMAGVILGAVLGAAIVFLLTFLILKMRYLSILTGYAGIVGGLLLIKKFGKKLTVPAVVLCTVLCLIGGLGASVLHLSAVVAESNQENCASAETVKSSAQELLDMMIDMDQDELDELKEIYGSDVNVKQLRKNMETADLILEHQTTGECLRDLPLFLRNELYGSDLRVELLKCVFIICLSILAGAIVTAPKLIQADSGRHDLKVPQAS